MDKRTEENGRHFLQVHSLRQQPQLVSWWAALHLAVSSGHCCKVSGKVLWTTVIAYYYGDNFFRPSGKQWYAIMPSWGCQVGQSLAYRSVRLPCASKNQLFLLTTWKGHQTDTSFLMALNKWFADLIQKGETIFFQLSNAIINSKSAFLFQPDDWIIAMMTKAGKNGTCTQ